MSQQPEKTREDSFREARKQIVRSAFLALAALGVIVFACYAWFVSSGTVTGKISSVLLNGSTFELASVGGSGAHDAEIQGLTTDETASTGETWPEAPTQTETDIGTITGSKNHILWNLSSTSNLNNRAGENTDTGIQPGDSGTLQFYVVPKYSGDLKLNCTVRLRPVKNISSTEEENGSSIIEITGMPVNNFVRGHMLFAYTYQYTDSYDDSYAEKNITTPALINYANGSFTLELTGVQENQPILVTLHWIWPLLLKDIIDTPIDAPLLGNDTTSTNVKGWMSNNPEHFFYSLDGEVGKPDFSDQNDKRKYNSYYNNADEYIGSEVYGVIVQLSAEAV